MTFLRAFFLFSHFSHNHFKLVSRPVTSVLTPLTVTITVSNENRYVQFYGFNHEYQRQNVHFVET